MLAMKYRGPYRVRIDSKPVPVIEHPEDVIVRVTRSDSLGADLCIDAVGGDAAGSALHTLLGTKLKLEGGAATALHWAIDSVKKGGIVSIAGVYGPTGNIVPIGNVVNKGITIRANQASVKRLLPRLIEHVQAGRINPKALITRKVPLEEVADARRCRACRDCFVGSRSAACTGPSALTA